MNKKSKIILYGFMTLSAFLCLEGFYIKSTKGMTNNLVNSTLAFVDLTTLPDLAILIEWTYYRHIDAIFKPDGLSPLLYRKI